MSKRLSAEMKIINLFDTLSDEGKRITLEVLKSKGPQPATKPRSRKPSPPSSPTTSDLSAKIKAVREATGQSRQACRQALDAANGDVSNAINALNYAAQTANGGEDESLLS